jgi:hypothetical protein
MSAKGDQVGERFVKVMGIVDYITKPFSPEAITAVVRHTIDKYAQRTKEEHTQPIIHVGGELDETDGGENGAAAAGRQRLGNALGVLRDGVAQAVAARIAGLYSLADAAHADGETPEPESFVPTDAAAIADAAKAALDDATLIELIESVQPGFAAGVAVDDRAVLAGNLQVVPIAEVLQLLDAQRQSGVLTVSRGQASVAVFFRDGALQLAIADEVSEEFLLGRFIVDHDLMTRQDFEGFLETRTPGEPLIGAQLVKLGYLSSGDLKTALKKQTSELVYEILRWNVGRFEFSATRNLPAQAVEAGLALDIEGILMEGFRRVDEWHLIEREIDNFDLVFLRNEDAVAHMGRGRLTREELAVLELVNGKNTVKEIVRSSRMGSFEVSKMLYRLLSIKLVRRRVMPVAV